MADEHFRLRVSVLKDARAKDRQGLRVLERALAQSASRLSREAAWKEWSE